MSTRTALAAMVRQFFEQDCAVAVHSLETMEEAQALSVIAALPLKTVSDVFQVLEPHFAANLLKELPPALFKAALGKLSPQQGASLLLHLSPERREELFSAIPEKSLRGIREILTYPENSAGRIMSPDFLVFHEALKVKNTIQRIRLLARKKPPSSYTYVVDSENRLTGVINMRDLMLASGDATLADIMRKDLFMIPYAMDREQVAEELTKRQYFAAPVVDSEHHLLGVVKADELIEDVREEATEDLQKMFGAGGDERVFSPLKFSLAKRLPWLHVNLATAFLAAGVVALFEDIIGKITVLAVFLPVVAGQGGNAGAQSLAVVMRGIVMREIPQAKVLRLVAKESILGLTNGIVIGLVTGLVAWCWNGNAWLGLVIGLAMIVNLTFAGLSGAAIPLIMKSLGLDPAQCSNIILTTITDVMGFFAFLGFAVLFQNYLVPQ